MKRSHQAALAVLRRKLPRRHRAQVDRVAWATDTAIRNMTWRMRNPSMWLRVRRLMRLHARGMTEIEA